MLVAMNVTATAITLAILIAIAYRNMKDDFTDRGMGV